MMYASIPQGSELAATVEAWWRTKIYELVHGSHEPTKGHKLAWHEGDEP